MPPPVPPSVKLGPDDRRQADGLERRPAVVHAVRDGGSRAFEADPVHRLAELEPVLGLLDRLGIGADQLDPKPLERSVLRQRQRGVQRRLPAHGGQDDVGLLLLDDLGHEFRRDRLDVGRVRKLRIGHDRRRVRIDDDDPIALFFQGLDRLTSRIVELGGLADDDRPGADDQDRGYVGALGHQLAEPLRVDEDRRKCRSRAQRKTQARSSAVAP